MKWKPLNLPLQYHAPCANRYACDDLTKIYSERLMPKQLYNGTKP